jgi:transcriptional regulator with XRE-family HTH domain
MNTETERRWVGLRLRHIRELADVSREQMAKSLGVTPGAVGHWESGRSLPNGRQLAIWARETGIPIDLLYRETGLLDDDEPVPAGLHGWYKARSGTIPAAASGITTTDDGGNVASEGVKRPLPRANATFERVPAFA